jgi:hypothetical protein
MAGGLTEETVAARESSASLAGALETSLINLNVDTRHDLESRAEYLRNPKKCRALANPGANLSHTHFKRRILAGYCCWRNVARHHN